MSTPLLKIVSPKNTVLIAALKPLIQSTSDNDLAEAACRYIAKTQDEVFTFTKGDIVRARIFSQATFRTHAHGDIAIERIDTPQQLRKRIKTYAGGQYSFNAFQYGDSGPVFMGERDFLEVFSGAQRLYKYIRSEKEFGVPLSWMCRDPIIIDVKEYAKIKEGLILPVHQGGIITSYLIPPDLAKEVMAGNPGPLMNIRQKFAADECIAGWLTRHQRPHEGIGIVSPAFFKRRFVAQDLNLAQFAEILARLAEERRTAYIAGMVEKTWETLLNIRQNQTIGQTKVEDYPVILGYGRDISAEAQFSSLKPSFILSAHPGEKDKEKIAALLKQRGALTQFFTVGVFEEGAILGIRLSSDLRTKDDQFGLLLK